VAPQQPKSGDLHPMGQSLGYLDQIQTFMPAHPLLERITCPGHSFSSASTISVAGKSTHVDSSPQQTSHTDRAQEVALPNWGHRFTLSGSRLAPSRPVPPPRSFTHVRRSRCHQLRFVHRRTHPLVNHFLLTHHLRLQWLL